MQEQIVLFVQEYFETKGMIRGVYKTYIMLIPKTLHAYNFNHFRPISLCNFSYKVVLKLLVARMKHLMSTIVSPNQRDFVGGRWIAENIVVAQELVHKVRKHKGKQGLMLGKVDLNKAYDWIE